MALSIVMTAGCIKTYNIGDTCPAGGIVFFDKGNNSDGWRYLSVAPAETEFEAIWSADWFDVQGTSTAIGAGKKNTELLVADFKQRGEKGTAAQLCDELKIGRYSDWFLPSKDELAQMYISLRQRGLGNFGDDWYCSSSQGNNSGAWGQSFLYGYQGIDDKDSTHRVRACRQF